MWETLQNVGGGDELFHKTLKLDKRDNVKLRHFCTAPPKKSNNQKSEELAHRLGKNIASYLSNKGLI